MENGVRNAKLTEGHVYQNRGGGSFRCLSVTGTPDPQKCFERMDLHGSHHHNVPRRHNRVGLLHRRTLGLRKGN